MSKVNQGKVAIVGCGFVGSASAFALMQSGLFTEMVLIDANHDKAEGEADDKPEVMMMWQMRQLLSLLQVQTRNRLKHVWILYTRIFRFFSRLFRKSQREISVEFC